MSLCAKCGSACGNDCYTSPETIRKQERERIIKLLEQMEKHIYYTHFVAPQGAITHLSESPVSITLADAIALIRGGNQ